MKIETKALYQLVDPEPYFILTFLFILAWLFYKLFLREVSDERHRNIANHLKNILHHFLFCSTFFSAFIFISQLETDATLSRTLPYLAIITMFSGMVVFVKVSRLIIL